MSTALNMKYVKIFTLTLALLLGGACQQDPAFLLDFGNSRLEVIINGQTYASDSTYNWGNVSNGDAIVVNGTLRNRSAFNITMAGTVPITTSGASAADISITQPANAVIAAGATESFSLSISPQTLGTRTAKILISTTPGNDLFTLNLSGSRHGIAMLKDINPGVTSSSPFLLKFIGATLYFAANNGTHGIEPWISDLTSDGTILLKDIFPGTGNSDPRGFTQLGSVVLFNAEDDATGKELWRTDGTGVGTNLVKDIYVGATNSNPDDLCLFNGAVYFSARTAAAGDELWKSDGTFGGTVMVYDLESGAGHGNYGRLFAHSATRLIFQGNKTSPTDYGREVFKSDGTIGPVSLVEDIRAGSGSSGATDFFSFNGDTVFSADNGTDDYLWKISSTSATSATLVDAVTPAYFTILGTNLLFAGTTAANGAELWISDSSLDAAGTQLLKDITVGATGSLPKYLTTVGDKVFFQACETATDCELWVTDGTNAGTVLVKDINPGAGVSSSPASFVAIGNIAYFTATDGVNGRELWRSDGTNAGTYMVADINPGAASSSPTSLVVSGSRIVFAATTAANGTELHMYAPPP